jgi:uncharacterized protein with WD repeat
VAAFVGEKGGAPAAVSVYDIDNLTKPVSERTFFNADSVDYHWNADGKSNLFFILFLNSNYNICLLSYLRPHSHTHRSR